MEQVRRQEEGLERESISRHTALKFARNGRIEESSGIASWRILCSKIERKSWCDTKAHFADTRVAREGEFHDSGDFQDTESNYSGNVSHVPSQPAVVPSPRSRLSRDKWMPIDTWNLSEPQGNVFGNPRPMFVSLQTLCQGILRSMTPSATGAIPVQVSTGRPVARGEERTGSTTTMPMSERKPSTMNSSSPVEVPQNSMAGQQRRQIPGFSSTNSPLHHHFFGW